MKYFEAYVDNWQSGDPIYLCLPDYGPLPGGVITGDVNSTIASAEANYPWFDSKYTFFTINTTIAANMRNQGFQDVIDLSQVVLPYVLCISSTKKIIITKTGDRYSWDSQDGGTSYTGGSFLDNTDHAGTLAGPYQAGASYGWPYPGSRVTLRRVSSTLFRPVGFSFESAEGLTVFSDIEPVTPPEPLNPDSQDPYTPGGTSGTGGGGGNFDGSSDNIDIPPLPSLSAVDSGFITLFNPSLTELKNLCSYMWSGLFDINTFRKIFADPMDCILGMSIVPVAVPNGGSKEVKVGNIGTGIFMNSAGSQYVSVDCGTINVNEYWGAYLDYAPYTKAEIYLPYVGTHAIDIDDIMGKTVRVVYHVDILSGAVTCYVKCGNSVLYTFIGQCSSSIPITGNDWTNVINGVINIAGSIGSMIASGGATAPMAIGSIASTAVNSLKPSVEKSGSMSGTGGMLAIQTPYLILSRPRQALPKNQNYFLGYPTYITEQLGKCSGYTEVEEIRLTGIPGTEEELAEINGLLKTGVIL